jgi:hypothetical protein
MATSKKQEVATKSENQVAVFNDEMPEYLRNATGNRGSEQVASDDMVLPRLEIVQSQSPIKDTNEDAREGYLFNSATNEVIGDTAYFVPIFFRKEWIVWKDKDEGGGFFGSFATEAEAKDRLKDKVADGEREEFLQIVDTPVHFGLLVSPSGMFAPQQIAISMAKSKAKVSRRWNSVIQMCGGDRFSRVYKITTFKDKNAKNQTFFNFVVSPAGFPPEEIYRLAEKTYEVFKTQNVRTSYDDVVDEEKSNDTIDRSGI